MTTMKMLTSYNKSLQKRIKRIDSILDIFIEEMGNLILDDMLKSVKKFGSNEVSSAITRKIYNSVDWLKMKNGLYSKADISLAKVLKNYKTEINNLFSLYPESSYNQVSIMNVWDNLEKNIKRSIDPETLMSGSKLKVQAYFDTVQAGLVTDNIPAMRTILSRYLNSNLKSFNVEYKTMQDNIFNKMRQDFFAKVDIKGQKKYIYAGGFSKGTRPFCAENLGQIKTQTEWKKTYNRGSGTMGKNAWDTKGGWNCRHFFLLVTPQWNESGLTKDFRSQIKNV